MTPTFEAIEDFLRQGFGYKTHALGPHTVERAASSRMARAQVTNPVDYLVLLRASAIEVQALLEEVVNRETWFFREPRVMDAAVKAIQDRMSLSRQLRLLSLPCSTGEEPYSLAMALLDSGLPSGLFEVDGIDISQRCIESAQAALYDRVSFRGQDLQFRDRHFTAVGHRWQLSDAVRSAVRFVRADAMRGLDPNRRYDVVVCRNLLIYLTPEAAGRLFEVLEAALMPDGCLVISASEASLVPAARFKHVFDTVFVRHAAPPPVRARLAAAAPLRAPVARVDPDTDMAAIIDMANLGDYQDAAERCQKILKQQGPSAQAYYLLGVVESARGDDEAAREWLRRAVYLDPGHEDARLLLSLTRPRG